MRTIFIILISFSSISQTLLKYDNIESYDWFGAWWNPSPAGYYTNAKVSGTTSAAILGTGNGTSAIEQNWYSLPNVSGLNPLYEYEFRFRLGSYTFSNSTATTKGVDVADIVELQVSRDNELTYTSEMRITGFNNSTWKYQSATINHIADGTFNSVTDVYQSVSGNNNGLSTGYSTIKLKITGVTQIAVDVLARVNSAGEEWWFDNFELWQITQPLYVGLIDFYHLEGRLIWQTATEINTDYFILYCSQDGNTWKELDRIDSKGNYNVITQYIYQTDLKGYFLLTEVCKNGIETHLKTIYVVDKKQRILINVVNMLGQSVDLLNSTGVLLLIYSDGTTERILK
jgi:hypothetical protein